MPPPELGKHAVYSVWVRQSPDREACAPTKVVRVVFRCGSTEATQDQIVVRIMSCIPYRHVLENTTVCT